MNADAKLRMDVYQEGQRAFNSKATRCPYTDWRAGTWAKGWAAAEAYEAYEASFASELVPEKVVEPDPIDVLSERIDALEKVVAALVSALATSKAAPPI